MIFFPVSEQVLLLVNRSVTRDDLQAAPAGLEPLVYQVGRYPPRKQSILLFNY